MNKRIFTVLSLLLIIIIVVVGYFTFFRKTITPTTKTRGYLALDFFAGGSIFGNSFKVEISQTGSVTYQESSKGGTEEVKKFQRDLTEQELDTIHKVILENDLVNLQSQDFKEEPLIPDQGYYLITISLEDKENSIKCSIPPPAGTQPTTKMCQDQLDKLRIKLNDILDVNIY